MDEILKRLDKIERLIQSQNQLQKSVLSLSEACSYLNLSPSHLYKLTSDDAIPHYKPNGKKIYFLRLELDQWLLRNRNITKEEMQNEASNYLNKKGGQNHE